MVVEVRQLHGPGELAGGPGSVSDSPHVHVVGLVGGMGQQCQRPDLDRGETVATELGPRDPTMLEQIVQQRRRAGLRRDSGCHALNVLDHRFAESTALTGVTFAGEHARRSRFQRLFVPVDFVKIL